MTNLILKEGEYIGYDERYGYVYKLNGSFYAFKSEMVKLSPI